MKPISINNGITFTAIQKKDGEGKIIQTLTETDLKDFYDKLLKLHEDFGLSIDKYGDVDKMQANLCKAYKKQWQKDAFDNGVEQMQLAINKANNVGTIAVKPEFKFEQ